MNPSSRRGAGEVVRLARQARRMTQAQLGERTGYSASQISRYERGLAPLTDTDVLRRFAAELDLTPELFGLLPEYLSLDRRHDRGTRKAEAGRATTVIGQARAAEVDPVRRRQLLTGLAVTAAAAAASAVPGSRAVVPAGEVSAGETLSAGVRDAMLGLAPPPAPAPISNVRAELAAALSDFHACRYRRLVVALPRLISSGHTATAESGNDPRAAGLLAEVYTLATRMLIKVDDRQLGWIAADRARVIATGADAPLIAAESARNLAVLARKSGWHAQATSIALAAADDPGLRGSDPALTAKRGQLLMCAAYTAAKTGDRSTMRELTNDAVGMAGLLGGRTLLLDHGGGFSPATVAQHRIAAEYSVGDPGAAIAAARQVPLASLPSVERRARYYTDVARAFDHWGRRDDCLRALLAAEREAPEETHARPAVRQVVSGLLVSGPTSPELRGLATRCGIT